MKCEDVQIDLALFVDDQPGGCTEAMNEHLTSCPLCRQTLSELRDNRLRLRSMARPAIPVAVLESIRSSVRAKAQPAVEAYGLLNPGSERRSYSLLFMSYAAGALASLVLGFTFLVLVSASGGGRRSDLGVAKNNLGSPVLISNNSLSAMDQEVLSPQDYASSRTSIAAISPSVNPQGSLISLTRSLMNGELKDDEVVVVADVYQNGSAQIAEVVEPSRNQSAVDELARAFDYDAGPAFVPSTLDRRSSDPVRVILKIQSVYVSTKPHPRRTRSL
jgi:hypothetical protein